MTCADIMVAKMLRDCADEIARRMAEFTAMPSLANLGYLNGAVARGVSTLTAAEKPEPHHPRGGAMKDGAVLAA